MQIAVLPRPVRKLETVWIPMPDGARLAASVWLPEDAGDRPVPAILEYIPYRRRDFTRRRDSSMHPYFAAHGFASIRLDLRGSGDSDGVLTDEYLPQELDDGVQAIDWIARQPWCSGTVGMIGISWGGFNGLQIAALRPKALGAVVTVASTDDRYADDVHHMGGCLLGDNLSWASVMFAYNSLPPDPMVVGERWRDMWHRRLDGSGLWLAQWLAHQRRDAYWAHGSVREDWDAIQCPVMAVSGWADGYSNSVFRLVEHLKVPVRGLIGPWSHKYPHIGEPGPAIGFLQSCVDWFRQWLRGEDAGALDGPALRVWMQDSMPPTTSYAERPGRWVGEGSWPSPRVASRRFVLRRAVLMPEGQDDGHAGSALPIRSPVSVGLYAGKWCSYAAPPDLPHDQREEDGGALVFDTAPLAEPIEILGRPTVELALASDRPVAMVAVRLSDLQPDDKATRVTYGLLNLTQRDSREHPEPMPPGQKLRVRVPMNGCAQHFPAGHRIRLAISTSYWPLAWLPPRPATLTVWTGESTLELPVRPPDAADAALPAFGPPEGAEPLDRLLVAPGDHHWRVIRDLARDVATLEVVKDDGVTRLPDVDLTMENRVAETYTTRADDFDSARGEVVATRALSRPGWSIRTTGRTLLTSTPESFRVRAQLDAWEGETRVFSRNWDEEIPRDFV